jgi:pilus assembly protein CpaF
MMTSGSDEAWFLEYEGRRIDLREGEVTLGRSRGCGVVLRDPSVSRGHALLSVRQGRVTLQDLRSSNGTYVNGKRLDKETVVEDGDRLVIGETELFLRRVRAGQAAPEGRRIETGEVSLFCPDCGLPIHGAAGGRCPGCGADLAADRSPRGVETGGLNAEPAGTAADSWDGTGFRQRVVRAAAGPRAVASPVGLPRLPPEPPAVPEPRTAAVTAVTAASAADPAETGDRSSTAETRPRDASGAIVAAPAELPMSVREVENRPPPTPPTSVTTPAAIPAIPAIPSIPPGPPLSPLSPISPAPPPEAGLWSRLTGYLRGHKEP